MKKLIPAFLLTLVNVLGFSILIPVLPFIVRDYGGNEFTYGLLISTYSVFQFFGAPILGKLSDRYGRRPILLVSQAGTFLAWIIFAGAYFVDQTATICGVAVPLLLIFGSRVFDGLTGGNISATNAYVSDLTTPKNKAKTFGQIGAVFGVGMIIGPALGGMSSGTSLGWLGTIILSASISLLTLVAIYAILPESLPPAQRAPQQPIAWRKMFNLFALLKPFADRPLVRRLLGLRFVFGTVMAGYTSIMVLYLIDLFGFNSVQIGYFLLFSGSFLIFNQGFLVNKFIRRFGEYRTLQLGLLSMSVGIIGMTLTDQLWLFVVIYYFLNLGISLCMPTLQALLLNQVSAQEQGTISGLDQSVGSICAAYAPALAGFIYLHWGDAIFWIFGIVILGGWGLSRSIKV